MNDSKKSKIASKMPDDSDALREYSRVDEKGRKLYRMPMGVYKRKGDKYIREPGEKNTKGMSPDLWKQTFRGGFLKGE